jgi:hypothetical protein
MLSDSELIQKFVEDSIQNREVLLSNGTLRAQRVFGINELNSKKESRLLLARPGGALPQFYAKANSSYWACINQILASQNFLISGEINPQGFYPYNHFKVPAGYQLNCTKSTLLWRRWWRYRQKITTTVIPQELWIRTRQTWYPIKNLTCSNELVYIQTLGSEVCVHTEDLVVWLERIQLKQQALTS